MTRKYLLYGLYLLMGVTACSNSNGDIRVDTSAWNRYNVGMILFEDKAPETLGSNIYHRIIPDAESYIKEQAKTVLATLYYSPKDSIVPVNKIYYTLEDIEGVSAKGGGRWECFYFL